MKIFRVNPRHIASGFRLKQVSFLWVVMRRAQSETKNSAGLSALFIFETLQWILMRDGNLCVL